MMLDVYDYSKAAANLRLKLADQENEALKDQLQALAAQNRAMRDAILQFRNEPLLKRATGIRATAGYSAMEYAALDLPDLATPILNKVREELSNEVAISMFEHFVTMINSPDLSIKRNGRCIKKEIIEDLRRAHLAAHLADAIEKGE